MHHRTVNPQFLISAKNTALIHPENEPQSQPPEMQPSVGFLKLQLIRTYALLDVLAPKADYITGYYTSGNLHKKLPPLFIFWERGWGKSLTGKGALHYGPL